MRRYRIVLVLLIAFTCAIDTKAQNLIEARDAQLKKLETASDNEKVVIMATLAKDYVFQNPDSGIYYMKLALDLARNITDEKVKASAYQSMGGGLLELGNLDSAAWYLLEAKRLHEEHKQPAEVVSDLNILTMVYRTARNFELSLNYGKSALAIHRSGVIPDSLKRDENSEAMTRNIIAWTYVKLGYADSAWFMMDTIRLKKYDKHFEWAFSRFILGDIANLKNQLPLAIEEYRKGLLAAQLKGTHIDSMPCQIGIADVQLKRGNPDSAIYYAMMPIYRYRSGLFPEQFVRAYEILRNAYKKKGVSDSALKYTELMASEQDKLYGSDKSIQLIELAAREKNEKRKNQEARKTLISNVKIYSLLAGLFILAFIGTVLFRNNRARRKTNHLLRAKNKELEIETALEKVRSRSLAMHKSEELREVVQVIFEKVRELGININDGALSILEFREGSRNHVQWIAGPYYDYPRSFAVPYMEHAPSFDIMNTHESRLGYFAKRYTKEEKNSFFKELFQIGEYKNLPEEVKNLILASEQYGISCAFASNSAILIHSNTGILLTPNEADILKRFARVFDQAYTRFLDLQKSEAHARETMIEAGLEKIRSRSLEMRSSEELKEVVAIVFEKLKEFGLSFEGAGIQLFTEGSKDAVLWVCSPEFVSTPTTINLPFEDDISLVNPISADVLKARNSNEKVIRKTYSFEDKNDYFKNVVFKYNDLSKISQEARDMILQAPGQTALSVMETYSSIGIDRWGGSDFTEQDVETLKRVAKVFDQVYIRFQDLQKAEAQAREAMIEAALERIRSRSMGMQKSSELRELVAVIFQQMQGLGFNLNLCNILLVNEQTNEVDYWVSFHEQGVLPKNYHIPYFDHPVYHYQLDVWKNASPFDVFELSGAVKKIWDEFLMTKTEIKELPVSIKEMMGSLEKIILSSVSTKNGLLQAVTSEPLSGPSIIILQRFAKVFDQTYTRFLDLQKSEERAQAAMLEASMERVRAETASMRHAADLERINPMIWKELAMLGVPFIRCGVFIIEEGQELIHAFLSTPDGKAIASFQLPFEQTEMIEMVDHWRRKEIYMQHWDKTKFHNWMDSLIREGYLENDNNEIQVVDNLYLHLFPFAQGLLYVGNVEALTEKNIKLAKNLSDAFSSAYARYEDFVRLERAKQQVDNALTELKQAQSQLVQSEKMASLGELTAGIAHEIQNPLNFVNNFSEINIELADEITHAAEHGDLNQVKELSASIKSNQEKINAHGRRADAIVKSMLQHSRSNTGANELTDINKLADEYLRLAYHGLRAKDKAFNASFEMDFDPSIGMVSVIPQEIGRVLLNLFNNAFYAVNEKRKSAANTYQPTVTVKTGRQNGMVELQVKDNGNGIPQKNIDKIFQPFFTTKPTGQGTGLGLSLGYDIIKAHGGELNVVSEDGEGSTFTIQIPA